MGKMMKPEKKYLSLFRGDDTAFNGGGGFDFVIETPEDTMDGFSIEFSFIGIKKTITEFRRLEEKRFAFSVQFTAQETKNLPLCFQNATMVMLQTVDGLVLRKTLTNKCLIHAEKHGNKLLITACIDNLLKGASGQALQNMNLMFGLEETTGLRLKPVAF